MTATPARQRARRMSPSEAADVVRLLETDFGAVPAVANGVSEGVVAHQMLLDALDRRQFERFLLWPGDDPVAVVYSGPGGTLMPAGDPLAGVPLAEALEHLGWRVLVGDAPLGWALVDAAGGGTGRGLFRRRISAREQRLMAVRAEDVGSIEALGGERPDPDGLRLARLSDVDTLVEQACRLHVEDQMGAPIARTARAGVRQRIIESVAARQTWVVEQGGRPVAKADLSLASPRRGAQIAGVYVDAEVRGLGIGGGMVAALVRRLLRDGAPAVSLHVRSDNRAAIAAYRSAGLVDRRPWVLALR